MSDKIAIDKDIPLPPPRADPVAPYPFADMAVGDSFIVPPIMSRSMQNAVARYKKNHEGWQYVCRKSLDGVRVWRLPDV
jgi:hypothetical protein